MPDDLSTNLVNTHTHTTHTSCHCCHCNTRIQYNTIQYMCLVWCVMVCDGMVKVRVTVIVITSSQLSCIVWRAGECEPPGPQVTISERPHVSSPAALYYASTLTPLTPPLSHLANTQSLETGTNHRYHNTSDQPQRTVPQRSGQRSVAARPTRDALADRAETFATPTDRRNLSRFHLWPYVYIQPPALRYSHYIYFIHIR